MNDSEKINFILGKESSEYLEIYADNFAYPDSTDFWDGNWIETRIKIKVGGFTGNYSAQIRNVDFLDLKNGLERLYNQLDGYANFNCLEEYLQIKIKGDGLGHFLADCIANDNPGIRGHELKFSIDFDQTEIHRMTKMIDDLLIEFPIKEMKKTHNNKGFGTELWQLLDKYLTRFKNHIKSLNLF
jgi:hypothetical protein